MMVCELTGPDKPKVTKNLKWNNINYNNLLTTAEPRPAILQPLQ